LPQLKRNGVFVDLAGGSQTMGRNPNKSGEGSKMGRAGAIQTEVVYFQRYHCLSLSVA